MLIELNLSIGKHLSYNLLLEKIDKLKWKSKKKSFKSPGKFYKIKVFCFVFEIKESRKFSKEKTNQIEIVFYVNHCVKVKKSLEKK